jgi:glycosyltransferase involved in cell wall biosynthesis
MVARILFVSHFGLLGGAERSLIDLLCALDRGLYAARVVVPFAGELSKELSALQISFEVCSGLRVLGRSLSPLRHGLQAAHLFAGARELRASIRRYAPAIVHANSTTAALYALCWPHQETPTVWHFRDLVLPRIIGRFLSKRCTRIIAPSRCCADLAASVGDPNKVVIVPNGIRVARPAGAPRAGRPGRTLVAMIGQAAPWKGHMIAIEAARSVLARRTDVDFLIVADDRIRGSTMAAELRRTVDAFSLGAAVEVSGPVADARAVLERADILIHPAFPEPAGRVVLEAMAAGCPVIAFEGPHGPAEVIRPGVDGVLAAPRTPEALASAILALVDDPILRGRMGEAGRERAAREFDRGLTAQRIQAVYSSILNRGDEEYQLMEQNASR